eukprot:TRINITY_DN8539_c1_g1_i1.p1 TRINITY_DN8539_c1_g1~~TRINITY_DN8539_c1_g1_i1.p1  ORF type:complete len:462 (-),score=137.36 TRINITY_DN8539_c1_g1_i1:24-1409(-)
MTENGHHHNNMNGGEQRELNEEEEKKQSDVSNVACRFFKLGKCSSGKKCKFSHETSPQIFQTPSTQQTPSPNNINHNHSPPTTSPSPPNTVCKYYQIGSCWNGTNCPFLHTNASTTNGSQKSESPNSSPNAVSNTDNSNGNSNSNTNNSNAISPSKFILINATNSSIPSPRAPQQPIGSPRNLSTGVNSAFSITHINGGSSLNGVSNPINTPTSSLGSLVASFGTGLSGLSTSLNSFNGLNGGSLLSTLNNTSTSMGTMNGGGGLLVSSLWGSPHTQGFPATLTPPSSFTSVSPYASPPFRSSFSSSYPSSFSDPFHPIHQNHTEEDEDEDDDDILPPHPPGLTIIDDSPDDLVFNPFDPIPMSPPPSAQATFPPHATQPQNIAKPQAFKLSNNAVNTDNHINNNSTNNNNSNNNSNNNNNTNHTQNGPTQNEAATRATTPTYLDIVKKNIAGGKSSTKKQ